MNESTLAQASDRLRSRLDTAAVRAVLRRRRRGGSDWLTDEIARRLADRVSLLLRPIDTVLEWNGALPTAESASRALPRARRTQVLPADVEPAAKGGWWPWRRQGAGEREDAVPVAAADLVWSNLWLPFVADPQDTFAAWHRALKVDGFLMFSTFGPGTLAPLRGLYATNGWGPPYAEPIDMHDLGDMLVQAGFGDPVMDQEIIHLTYDDPGRAIAELRSIGGNLAPARFAGLRGRRWRGELLEALESLRGPSGRIDLPFEVAYGHAIKPVPRALLGEQTAVPLDDMRAMLRNNRAK